LTKRSFSGIISITKDKGGKNMKNLKVGDQVRVTINGQGSVWESGKIMRITEGKAYIGYGSKNLPDDLRVYGAGTGIPLSKLEKM
jgi:hypothetical protein